MNPLDLDFDHEQFEPSINQTAPKLHNTTKELSKSIYHVLMTVDHNLNYKIRFLQFFLLK